jgi:hypothetical protein
MSDDVGRAVRDYQALLSRIEARATENLIAVGVRSADALRDGTPDAAMWDEHTRLLRYALQVVAQLRRELDAEPRGYRAQASAVELANALGLRE